MNTIEDRLRAATQAAAGTVAPGSAPPLHLPSQPGHRLGIPRQPHHGGWRRWAAPLAAAASVIAVVAASLVIAGGSHGRRAEPSSAANQPAAVPPFNVALIGDKPGPAMLKQHAVVRATATGAILATITAPAPYGTFAFVTAASDDRTFVLAAQRWVVTRRGGGTDIHNSPTKYFLLRIGPAGGTTRLTALPIRPQSQSVAAIALSPDGSRLAVAFNRSHGDVIVHPTIQVFTLATGSVRMWAWPGRAWITNNDAEYQQLLSWTADGRTIAFEQWVGDDEQVRLLNTAAPGSNLGSSTLALDFRHQAFRTWKFVNGKIVDALSGYNALITPDGTKIVSGTVTETNHPRTTDMGFTEFSSSTGRAVSALYPWRFKGFAGPSQDVLWTSPSGKKLIVTAHKPGANPAAYSTVVGVLTGNHFTPLPGASPDITEIAW